MLQSTRATKDRPPTWPTKSILTRTTRVSDRKSTHPTSWSQGNLTEITTTTPTSSRMNLANHWIEANFIVFHSCSTLLTSRGISRKERWTCQSKLMSQRFIRELIWGDSTHGMMGGIEKAAMAHLDKRKAARWILCSHRRWLQSRHLSTYPRGRTRSTEPARQDKLMSSTESSSDQSQQPQACWISHRLQGSQGVSQEAGTPPNRFLRLCRSTSWRETVTKGGQASTQNQTMAWS